MIPFYRFQAGPEWRTGRTGPHFQPGDWLRLDQCQRYPRHRWPGHMKTNTFHPTPLPRFSATFHFPRPSFFCPASALSPSWSCGRGRGSGGVETLCFPRPLFISTEDEDKDVALFPTKSSPLPFSPTLSSPLHVSYTEGKYLSLSGCLLHEGKWVWGPWVSDCGIRRREGGSVG